uniref:Piriformospora indica-insensitive protein 2 n=1 Tax=Anthurium amnicola TaxID=1678845 RepID=A0A1D1YSX6_9ARAE
MRTYHQFRALLIFSLLFFNVALGADESTASPMEMAEQEALYSAIQGFVGKSWNGSELYPDPCGWTPIQGVSCDLFDGTWYVTVLSIGPVLENSLECAWDAEFTPHLFDLRHLKSLSIFDCFPHHRQRQHPAAVPSQSWEKLAGSLETLEFRSNRGLGGGVPPGIGRLTSLQSLVMVENGLTGELPQELGNLVRLKRLVLSGNQFFGQVPASLGYSMDELLILDLSRNSLTGPLPASLGGLSSLLKLDLSNNLLDGQLPSELGKLRNLTLLDLRNNRLSGGVGSSLHGMASLQEMLLSNNPLGGNLTYFPWEKMENLTTVDLSNTGLAGNIPESMAALTDLRFLALDNNHLLGEVPAELAALPMVGALYLNGNNLTGQLGFSEGFYRRMGRRFAAWGNPDLCYSAAEEGAGLAPVGVEQCKQEQGGPAPSSAVRNGVGGGSPPDQGTTLPASTSGFSATPVGGFPSVVLLVVVLLL